MKSWVEQQGRIHRMLLFFVIRSHEQLFTEKKQEPRQTEGYTCKFLVERLT